MPQQASAEVTRLAKLQADLAGVRAERDAFKGLVAQLKNDTQRHARWTVDLAPPDGVPDAARESVRIQLLGDLAQVETQRSQLLIHRTLDDSDVRVLTARIHEMEGQLQGISRDPICKA